jgi:hypothetical protein
VRHSLVVGQAFLPVLTAKTVTDKNVCPTD